MRKANVTEVFIDAVGCLEACIGPETNPEGTAFFRFSLGKLDQAAGHAIRGERDQAISALTRAVEAGYRDLYLLEIDPLWRELHGDKRFVQLVSKLKEMLEVMRVRARAQQP